MPPIGRPAQRALAASLGQVVGAGLDVPQPLMIGELNVLAASVAAWTVVLLVRLARF